jgi:hypothetical protein
MGLYGNVNMREIIFKRGILLGNLIIGGVILIENDPKDV